MSDYNHLSSVIDKYKNEARPGLLMVTRSNQMHQTDNPLLIKNENLYERGSIDRIDDQELPEVGEICETKEPQETKRFEFQQDSEEVTSRRKLKLANNEKGFIAEKMMTLDFPSTALLKSKTVS